MVAEITYPEVSLELRPDQICTLVTDGVVEATSASTRELFGFGRTERLSAQSAAEIAETARKFGEGASQSDDITVLSIALGPQASAAVA